MASTTYLPPRDGDFDSWLLNFTSLLSANPTTYGQTAPVATACAAAYASWHAAYLLAIDPSTRTPARVADKDAERIAAEQLVRPVATQISSNPAVADTDKVAIGVTVRQVVPSPVPAPTTFPILAVLSLSQGIVNFEARDSSTPTTKAKPYGCIAMELRGTYGTAPAVSPDVAGPLGLVTKVPNQISTTGQSGKVLTIWGRWVTRGGTGGQSQYGPWSAAVSTVVV